MIKIINKKGKVKVGGQIIEATFHDLITIAIDNVGQSGLTVFENIARNKLKKRIEPKYLDNMNVDAEGILEIEDGDLEKLQNLIKDSTYNCTGDFITEFALALKLIDE